MYNKVELCGINTANLTVLSETEKSVLLKKTKEGDKKAREKLINGNLRLVLSVMQSFSARGENPDDLFQVGCIGLIKAVDNFDVTLDVKFSTYAVPMILGEIRRYLRDNNSIRVSRSVRDLAYRALSAKEKLSASLSRDPTVEEIAKELNEKKEDVVRALDAIMEPMSIYEPVYSENGDSIYLLDQISDKKNTDENWLTDIAVSEAIRKLNRRERSILWLRFYKGKTQTEVAEEIGISQAQVSRIEKNSLDKIKKEL
ncbi:MAG: RNA polymerase sporulation sigma factor SigG [Clostridia bacterium]|nr:RNA polymerase sporulation sigma factor SigG [Clostridia bacterium]